MIWYDAVTTQGELKWQDTLNYLNADFFAVSSAIFINYTWKAGTPAEAAAAAGPRALDVFMGIDVFGRNTFGGGGFNCSAAAAAAKLAGTACRGSCCVCILSSRCGLSGSSPIVRANGMVAASQLSS